MKELFAGLRARLRSRPDSEHEQAIVRLVVGGLLFIYLLPRAFNSEGVQESTDLRLILAMVGYLAVAVAIFGGILIRPGASRVRRLLATVVDAGAITFFMIQTDDHGAPLFLIYLWITLANGFRFGNRYLISALLLSCVGFTVVLALGEFWRSHLDIGVGLMVGFIAISLYVLTLVNRMFDAIARAEAANQAKRRFISMVSHEMRTPLNAVIGTADLLRETDLNSEQAEMVHTVSSSSRVLLGLVEDVLDFSKIEAGKLSISVSDFDLHGLVNGVARILSPHAREKGLDYQSVIMPDVPHALKGDPHYLRQVLLNLIGNAVKFTLAGSVTIHVAKVAETPADATLKFSVRDTGIGISPESQGRIFESFTQADDSTTRRFGGTGLGTTISKQLVELMGGRIGLESAVGLGSTFWFEVQLQKQAGRPEQDEAAVFEGSRVLLVGAGEDVERVGETLSGWGIVWTAAPSADHVQPLIAREVRRGETITSLVLFAESVKQGQAASLRLRAVPAVAHVALILVVPRGSADARHADPPPGFNAVLETPFDKRLLFNALHAVAAEEPRESGVVSLHEFLQRRERSRDHRVLVADDHPTNREVISKILERAGHVVLAVESGDAALDALESDRFDVLVLDRNMPGMSGIDVARALRLTELGERQTPLIMLSADVTTEAKDEASQAGIDLFLPKPIQAGRLLEAIAQLCDRREADKTSRSPAPGVVESPKAASGVLNRETLALLEGLGTPHGDFMERLIRVFIQENAALVRLIQEVAAEKRFSELRGHLHALKGSAASIGTDRLAEVSAQMHALQEAQLRTRGTAWANSIAEEFETARLALVEYLEHRDAKVRHGS